MVELLRRLVAALWTPVDVVVGGLMLGALWAALLIEAMAVYR